MTILGLQRQDEHAVMVYNHYYQSDEHREMPVWVDDHVQAVFADASREDAIVDVGCGLGRMVSIARELGFERYVGIDLSAVAIQICLRNRQIDTLSPECTFRWCDVRDMGKHFPRSFGAFMCTAMLMHLSRDDAPEAVRSLRNSLKDGAPGLVATPAGEYADQCEVYSGFKQTLYTPAELTALFEECGFTVRAVWHEDGMLIGHVVASQSFRCT